MKRNCQGFALVEAIVALGIIAAILGVTFETIGMARGAMAQAEQRRIAMLQARSLIAELGATLPLVPGSVTGDTQGRQWRVDIEPVSSREIEAPLMRASVTIKDGSGRPLARLETLRLAQ